MSVWCSWLLWQEELQQVHHKKLGRRPFRSAVLQTTCSGNLGAPVPLICLTFTLLVRELRSSRQRGSFPFSDALLWSSASHPREFLALWEKSLALGYQRGRRRIRHYLLGGIALEGLHVEACSYFSLVNVVDVGAAAPRGCVCAPRRRPRGA
jgi:hypothetical protein